MKLAARTDLDAPLAFVYAALADHAAWERLAAERGLQFERPANLPLTGPGAGWLLRLPYRGKLVEILLRVLHMAQDQMLAFDFESSTIHGEFDLTLMALSPRRTRLHVTIEVKARTIAARLLLNTMRLAKGRVEGRLQQRLTNLAAQIERRYAQSAA